MFLYVVLLELLCHAFRHLWAGKGVDNLMLITAEGWEIFGVYDLWNFISWVKWHLISGSKFRSRILRIQRWNSASVSKLLTQISKCHVSLSIAVIIQLNQNSLPSYQPPGKKQWNINLLARQEKEFPLYNERGWKLKYSLAEISFHTHNKRWSIFVFSPRSALT